MEPTKTMLGRTFARELTSDDGEDIAESSANSSRRKPKLLHPVNVREFLHSFLDQGDGFIEAKSPLKQAEFMNHIVARVNPS